MSLSLYCKIHKTCFGSGVSLRSASEINTALEISTHDEQVNELVANGVREIEAFFRRSIEVGQARGEIPKGLDPEATAEALLALIVAIRVPGRGVFAEASLHTIADEGNQLIGLNHGPDLVGLAWIFAEQMGYAPHASYDSYLNSSVHQRGKQ